MAGFPGAASSISGIAIAPGPGLNWGGRRELSFLAGLQTAERVGGRCQRNLTKEESQHGPSTIKHEHEKTFSLAEWRRFPVFPRKDEWSLQRIVVADAELERFHPTEAAGQAQIFGAGLPERRCRVREGNCQLGEGLCVERGSGRC